MPGAEDREQKTERATPRKREQAREKGQVAKSKEASSAAIMLAAILIFYFFGQTMVESMKGITKELLMESGVMDMSDAGLHILLKRVLLYLGYILLPLLIFPVFAVASNILQVGFMFTTEPLAPNFSKLNPMQGIKNMVSLNALVELIKSILKLSLIGYAAYFSVKGEMVRLGQLADMDTIGIIVYFGHVAFKMILITTFILLILSVVDYVYQRWDMEKNLRMTKQEVKEEYKDTEGKPEVKSRIRTLQMELARKRMMQEVPKATAVITNPTHLAVAIKYEQGVMHAPVVVAKGGGIIAQNIKEIAKKHGVPIVENKPLARALWKSVDIGREIPVSLYKAVAELLAYVFKLKRAL